MASRFLAGWGIGAEPPISDTYLSDLRPLKQRGRYTALAYTLSFLGVPLAGFLGRWLVPIAPLGIAPLARGATALFAVVAAALIVVALDVGLLGPRTNGRSLDGLSETPVQA